MGVVVGTADPFAAVSRELVAALWEDIQRRYDFRGECDMLPEDFAGPGGGFWVATLDARPVGCAGLKRVGPAVAELDAMYVRPECRGSGVGGSLVRAVLAAAADRAFRVVRLRAGTGQPEAVRLYTRHGFRPVTCGGRYDESDGTLCFELSLRPSPDAEPDAPVDPAS